MGFPRVDHDITARANGSTMDLPWVAHEFRVAVLLATHRVLILSMGRLVIYSTAPWIDHRLPMI